MLELRLAGRMSRLGTETAFEVLNRARALEKQGKEIIHLEIGEPDFDTPWHVRESTVFALERGVTHYTSNLGYLELRRALARYVAKAFGADYNPENEILITVGVSETGDQSLDKAIKKLLAEP